MDDKTTRRRQAELQGLLATIQAVSQEFPQLRLGQLIVNALQIENDKLFYMENNKFAEKILDYANNTFHLKNLNPNN